MNNHSNEINAYFDGEYCNSSGIKVGILSNSLNYGTGVIESIRIYKKEGHYFTIGLHQYLKRFITAIEKKGFKLEIDIKTIIQTLRVLLGKNQNYEHPYFRLVWYIGDESINTMSTDSHFAIVLNDLLVPDMGGLEACFSEFFRLNSSLHKLKLSSNYARNIIEQSYARQKGFNYVIFLGEQGEVLEGLSENIFIQKGKEIFTPQEGNILSGVNRAFIIDELKKKGISVIEKVISTQELLSCDGIIVSGSATGVRRIRKVESTSIDSQKFYELVKGFYGDKMDTNSKYISKLL